jgi:hypothetical protein
MARTRNISQSAPFYARRMPRQKDHRHQGADYPTDTRRRAETAKVNRMARKDDSAHVYVQRRHGAWGP